MNTHRTQSSPPRITGGKILIGTAALAMILLAGLQARTWTSADGSKTFEAELRSYDAATGSVTVTTPYNRTMKFKQDVLSANDIAFLKENGSKAPGGTSSGTTGAKELPDDLPDPDGKEADMSKPVQVFILMGQSNMLGFGNSGQLKDLAKTKDEWTHLVDDDGNWTTRKDVRNVRVMNFKDHLNDWLSGGNSGSFGPEIGFGYIMGEILDAPVLILKSCIGNRSLGWDLLPPGSEQFEADGKIYAGYKDSPDSWNKGEEPKPIGWYAGKQYDDDTGSAKRVLENLDRYYPGAKDYEIAGFVFWQGDKDRYNDVHADRYEQNLVQLIKQLREDFDAPNAKFVCATLGQTKKGAGGNEGKILKGTLAVDGEAGKYKEFQGNVASVYSHPLSAGGSSNGHYNKNATTYINIGDALGRAMAELFTGQ